MLRNKKQRSDSIEKSLQIIHSLITLAICPPWPRNEDQINQAKASYNKLLQHQDTHLYDFLPFDEFVKKADQMPRWDIFYAYITKVPENFVQMKFSSGKRVVPANAYEHKEGKVGKHFEESVFEQMDIAEILRRNYFTERSQSHMVEPISVSETVRAVEANIVALSMGKGSAFGTGILIDSELVLTSRHCIEERNIQEIVIRTNFQLQEDGSVDIWARQEIEGIVELGTDLDYAIILLSRPIQNFQKIDLLNLFDLEDQTDGVSLLIHHPKGWVKKVSSHNSLESCYKKLNYVGLQDSSKGSSGGAYINAKKKIFALHGLNMHGQTNAIFIKDIYQQSKILQNIDARVLEGNTDRVEKSQYSIKYHAFLETLESKPTSLETYIRDQDKRLPGAVSLSYHHIIPKANLEFLWMLGKLKPLLEERLKLLAWNIKLSNPTLADDHTDVNGSLFVQNIIWAPWNLFLGPEARSDDSKSIDGFDGLPFSFNEELWNKISELNNLIEQAWSSSFYSQEQITRGWINKPKDKITKEKIKPKKADVIKTLDRENKDASVLHEKPDAIEHDLTSSASDELSSTLHELIKMRSANRNPNYLHRTRDEDWVYGDQLRYSIEIAKKPPTETDVQHNTLYIYIESSRLFYAYKDKKLKLIKKPSEGGDGDLFQKVSSYTDENILQLTLAEESTILKTKNLLGNYRLKVKGKDDPNSKIGGLMSFCEGNTPMQIAQSEGREGIVSLLSKNKALRFSNTQDKIHMKAQIVHGFYSNNDVIILIDALLQAHGYIRIQGGNTADIVQGSNGNTPNDGTMVLSPIVIHNQISIAKEKAIYSNQYNADEASQLVAVNDDANTNFREAMRALSSDIDKAQSNQVRYIFAPVNLWNYHWITLQIEIKEFLESKLLIEIIIHDSLSKYEVDDESKKYKAEGENAKKINELITLLEENYSITICTSVLVSIQHGTGNNYCGGYTARLIANLATGISEDWNISGNDNTKLREEDVTTVNTYSQRAGSFGIADRDFSIEQNKKEEQESQKQSKLIEKNQKALNELTLSDREEVKNIYGILFKLEEELNGRDIYTKIREIAINNKSTILKYCNLFDWVYVFNEAREDFEIENDELKLNSSYNLIDLLTKNQQFKKDFCTFYDGQMISQDNKASESISSTKKLSELGKWIEVKNLIESKKLEFSLLPKETGSEMDIFHWAAGNINKAESEELEALFWVIDYFLELDLFPTYDVYTCTAIHHLAYYKETENRIFLMKKLLKKVKQEDINSYDGYGKTPLLEAIERGNDEIAKILIEHPLVDITLIRKEVSLPSSHEYICYTRIRASPYGACTQHQRNEIKELISQNRKFRENKPNIRFSEKKLLAHDILIAELPHPFHISLKENSISRKTLDNINQDSTLIGGFKSLCLHTNSLRSAESSKVELKLNFIEKIKGPGLGAIFLSDLMKYFSIIQFLGDLRVYRSNKKTLDILNKYYSPTTEALDPSITISVKAILDQCSEDIKKAYLASKDRVVYVVLGVGDILQFYYLCQKHLEKEIGIYEKKLEENSYFSYTENLMLTSDKVPIPLSKEDLIRYYYSYAILLCITLKNEVNKSDLDYLMNAYKSTQSRHFQDDILSIVETSLYKHPVNFYLNAPEDDIISCVHDHLRVKQMEFIILDSCFKFIKKYTNEIEHPIYRAAENARHGVKLPKDLNFEASKREFGINP